jgi:hypothetical protein
MRVRTSQNLFWKFVLNAIMGEIHYAVAVDPLSPLMYILSQCFKEEADEFAYPWSHPLP